MRAHQLPVVDQTEDGEELDGEEQFRVLAYRRAADQIRSAAGPIAEAEHFLSVANSQPGKPGDLLVLDLETTNGRSVAEVNAWAKAWLSHVEAKTGVKPMFYSGWHFADTYGAGLALVLPVSVRVAYAMPDTNGRFSLSAGGGLSKTLPGAAGTSGL